MAKQICAKMLDGSKGHVSGREYLLTNYTDNHKVGDPLTKSTSGMTTAEWSTPEVWFCWQFEAQKTKDARISKGRR